MVKNTRRKQLTPEQEKEMARERVVSGIGAWVPKTDYGKKVKTGEIKDIMTVLNGQKTFLESEIVDALVPNLENELLIVGQSKGKFGGGAGRIFKQTQKKTREGNKPSFGTMAVVGNKDGLVGLGFGKAKETVPAREKALRQAKLSLIAIRRGSGDWESDSTAPHTIPYKVTGNCGSIEMTLMPAPVGTGLVIHPECKKILELAGIKNVWSKVRGHTPTKINVLKACFNALQQLNTMKLRDADMERLHIVVGPVHKTGTLIEEAPKPPMPKAEEQPVAEAQPAKETKEGESA